MQLPSVHARMFGSQVSTPQQSEEDEQFEPLLRQPPSVQTPLEQVSVPQQSEV
jgi:hypothetical protein